MLIQTISTVFSRWPSLVSACVVFFCLFVFYSNSFLADWHYDDLHHIKENINVRRIDNIPMFFTDASTFSRDPNTAMYRPLLMTSLALNYQMGIWSARDGYYVLWYHLFNFLFHVATTLTILFTLQFLFRERIPVEGLPPHLPALFGALLFGLNTINTETVVYISSRSSGLATAFVLASFYLYLRAAEGGRKVRFGLLLVSATTFLCGMLCKEEAIALGLILVFYEMLLNRRWMAGEPPARIASLLAVRLAPHAVAGAVFLGVRQAVLHDNLAARIFQKGGTQAAPDMISQLATQTRAWIYYLREWVLPTSLSIDKPFAISHGFTDIKVSLSLALITAILAAAFLVRRRHPAVIFGVLWWFTALLPTSIIRLNVPINDHRLYLPGFGLVLVFSYLAGRAYVLFFKDGGWYLGSYLALTVAVLLLMGVGTFKRNMAFATMETIWKDVILKDPMSARGHNNLGIYYEQKGELDKAVKYYNKTVQLAPDFPVHPYINLGNVYQKKRDYAKAEEYLRKAISREPDLDRAWFSLGNVLRDAGRIDEAIDAYKKALKLNARYLEAANNLAYIHFSRLEYQLAVDYYQKALFIDPTFAMSYYFIALSYENLKQYDKAIEAFRRFVQFSAGNQSFTRKAEDRIRQMETLLEKPQERK